MNEHMKIEELYFFYSMGFGIALGLILGIYWFIVVLCDKESDGDKFYDATLVLLASPIIGMFMPLYLIFATVALPFVIIWNIRKIILGQRNKYH